MMPYIKVFPDMSATIDLLSDAEAGRLFKAVLHYGAGVNDELPGQEKLVFAMLKSQIDRDAVSYRDFCDKQRENGSKGGRPKKPTVFEDNPENPVVFSKTQKSQDKEEEEEKDKEKDKEEDNKVRKRKRKAQNIPPSLEEVRAYIAEKGYNIDPEHFVDYYAVRGWKTKTGPIQDWQACVRTWVRNNYSQSKGGVTNAADKQPDTDLFAGFSEEQIAEIERLANDGEHWG